ncbi:MAG TPA: hypothetical protein VFS44_01810 [Gemmatimonadaceae bacterium]|nr:hypothetical protein [Gemmatimonadaceae bacterium]
MHRTHIASAALTVLLAACASSSHTAASDQSPKPAAAVEGAKAAKPKADPTRITAEEITAANLPTAYDLVDRLRRPWLRRDAVTGGAVAVYMDEQNIGDAQKLRDIPTSEVAELRYLKNEDAIRRWGSSVTGSVILVVRRR